VKVEFPVVHFEEISLYTGAHVVAVSAQDSAQSHDVVVQRRGGRRGRLLAHSIPMSRSVVTTLFVSSSSAASTLRSIIARIRSSTPSRITDGGPSSENCSKDSLAQNVSRRSICAHRR
jgi:hypothetical protein